ncbi:DsbA family protein [Boseongicola aestuarii]|uniref:DSBA-like thioredoxin domain protein n=1 Tax=Boseongicola aestuarii TaxID=1470561 RepID=A0A238IZC9_9RHOB|nr:DsbA family protein [Boseongicola aestuarii]SMX23225.1 DSBA-like thioredoxin domain protein [Boseongicola aestuarii]
MSEKPKTSRRDLFLGLGAIALVGGGWQAWVHRPRKMTFEPIDGLPGWRKTVFEGVSAPRGGLSTTAAFAGLGNETTNPTTLSPEQLCRTLFQDAEDGRAPVAAFSDFFCPYCRTLTERLAARASDAASQPAITWHELPLLGPSSVIAARAAVAADLQGRYPEFQAALNSSQFRPTTRHIADTADAAGVRPGKLLIDMDGQIVASRLARSRAAAQTLGIYGTPALVIGRTLVIGEISDRNLDELLAAEANTPASC